MKIVLILGQIADHVIAVRGFLDNVPPRALVLVNDPVARDALRVAGLTARTLTEQVPIDSAEDFRAYDRAHRAVADLERSLDDVRHGHLPIIGAIEADLVTDLIFFHRAVAAVDRAAADGRLTVVFALTHYNASYVALTALFALLGHSIEGPLVVTGAGLMPLERPLVEDRLARMSLDVAATIVSPQTARRPEWLPSGTVRSIFYLLTNDADLYLKPVYPVIEEFRASGTPFLALTDDPRVIANLAARDISVTDVRSVLPADGLGEELQQVRLGAVGRLFRALDHVTVADPALAVLLRRQAHDAVVARINDWLQRADALDDALTWCLPSSVFLMPDAMGSSVFVTRVARVHGVPTVTTVAASVAGTARALGTYRADLLASYGHECSEAFKTIGWDPARIVLTGAPTLDGMRRRSREADRATVALVTSVAIAAPLIVVLTSRTSDREDDWIVELARGAASMGWQILLKAHPQHGLSAYAEVARRSAGLPLRLVEHIETAALVNAADVVVTDYSHAGREALAADRPLVAVNVTGMPYPNNRYDEEGVAVPARTATEVPSAVARALSDPGVRADLGAARTKLVDRFNWKNDGLAARRIYELLLDPPTARSTDGTRLP